MPNQVVEHVLVRYRGLFLELVDSDRHPLGFCFESILVDHASVSVSLNLTFKLIVVDVLEFELPLPPHYESLCLIKCDFQSPTLHISELLVRSAEVAHVLSQT